MDLRPPPFVGAAPGVLCRRAMTDGFGKCSLHTRLRFARPVRYQPIAQRPVAAAQMDRSIQTLVNCHRLGLDKIFDQVDLAFMLDGGIGMEPPLGFLAEHRIPIQPRRHPAMQIRGLSRLHPEALVVEWQIPFENLVGLPQG